MAKRIDTTSTLFTEPRTGGLRAVFARFAALTASLVELTDSELDLDGYDGQDPALSAFTGAVNAARARTLAHCTVFLAIETDDESVLGLQSVTKMIRTVLTSSTATEVAMIRNILAMRDQTIFFAFYRPGHPRYNGLLEQACDALACHIALPRAGGGAADLSQMMEPTDGTIMAHTAMSRAFTTLLETMDRCVHAEQPLQRPVAGDVRADRFGLAMQDAEAALTDMHAALHQVLAADLVRREDRALWETG